MERSFVCVSVTYKVKIKIILACFLNRSPIVWVSEGKSDRNITSTVMYIDIIPVLGLHH